MRRRKEENVYKRTCQNGNQFNYTCIVIRVMPS